MHRAAAHQNGGLSWGGSCSEGRVRLARLWAARKRWQSSRREQPPLLSRRGCCSSAGVFSSSEQPWARLRLLSTSIAAAIAR